MQLFTICFCNIFAPKKPKKNQIRVPNKKKSKLDGLQKKRKRKKKSKKRITIKM